jgi:Mg2+-importing ATPase
VYTNPAGRLDTDVFRLAYNNAFHQAGKRNGIDTAILNHATSGEKSFSLYVKVGEIPINVESRRSSSIVRNPTCHLIFICKGAFEEVLSLSHRVRVGTKVIALTEEYQENLSKRAAAFNSQGFRSCWSQRENYWTVK